MKHTQERIQIIYTLNYTASSQKYGYAKSFTCGGSGCEVSQLNPCISENILMASYDSMTGAEDVNKPEEEVLGDFRFV